MTTPEPEAGIEKITLNPFQQILKDTISGLAGTATTLEQAMFVQDLMDSWAAGNINMPPGSGLPKEVMRELRVGDEAPIVKMNKRIGPSSAQPTSVSGQEAT